MRFMVSYDNDVIDQRYDDVLGLKTASFTGKTLSDFQWYRTSDSTAIPGQVSAVLNFYDIPYGGDIDETYYVCFTINKGQTSEVKTCACAKAFNTNGQQHQFAPDSVGGLTITATYSILAGDKVFVNANYGGKSDIECYAQWITPNGKVYQDLQFTIPDGGCTIDTPKETGLYLLRVYTDGKSRSFKILIQ
jgi:hypothetical protein